MGLFDFFKKKKETSSESGSTELIWIEPQDNQWNVRLVDLRPLTQVFSASNDPQMAENAVSYGSENGTTFWGVSPKKDKTVPSSISIPIDDFLSAGVLFTPREMEQKWAIYFDGENLIFVRSWRREVFVIAKTRQENGRLFVETITGEFTEDESAELTNAILNYLLLGYAMRKIVPVPLIKELEIVPLALQSWAVSVYGNIAQIGVFDESFIATTTSHLRTESLLHIAAARNDVEAIDRLVQTVPKLDYLASDGMTPLHWALAAETIAALERLLALGANPNARSYEGATPIMNAVQSNEKDAMLKLIQAGADVNARDDRGFTSLHRACEMGHLELVRILLEHGADKTISAEGHTALSLATLRKENAIMNLLK